LSIGSTRRVSSQIVLNTSELADIAFNNGFVVFECAELVTHLRETLTDRAPTAVGPEITIDYAKSILSVDGKSFVFPRSVLQRRN